MAPRGGMPLQRRTASRPIVSAVRSTVGPRPGCPVSAVLTVALVTVQLLVFLEAGNGPAWAGVLVGTLFLLALPVAVGLWAGRLCECRFFALALALVVAVGQVLAATVGGPGAPSLGWSSGRVLVVALAVVTALAVPGLAALRARAGRAERPGGATDPYASSDGTAPAGRGGRRRDRRAAATDVGA